MLSSTADEMRCIWPYVVEAVSDPKCVQFAADLRVVASQAVSLMPSGRPNTESNEKAFISIGCGRRMIMWGNYLLMVGY